MKRRHAIMMHKRTDSATGVGGWQIIYTGFVLILLCFFIMLTSFASLQDSKITRFTKSFSNAVSVFSGGKSIESGETMIDTDAMVVDKEDPLALLFEKVKMHGRQSGLDHVQIRRSKRGVIMTLADKMLFESGDAALSQTAYPLLAKISAIINAMAVHVDIEGHTDDRPIKTALYPSNWELSTARAVNVLRYMITAGGVKSERLSAVGHSKYQPLVPNSSGKNRAQNRRVEFIFTPEIL